MWRDALQTAISLCLIFARNVLSLILSMAAASLSFTASLGVDSATVVDACFAAGATIGCWNLPPYSVRGLNLLPVASAEESGPVGETPERAAPSAQFCCGASTRMLLKHLDAVDVVSTRSEGEARPDLVHFSPSEYRPTPKSFVPRFCPPVKKNGDIWHHSVRRSKITDTLISTCDLIKNHSIPFGTILHQKCPFFGVKQALYH